MKTSRIILLVAAVLVGVFAVITVATAATHANPPVIAEPAWDSPRTRATFMQACGDCHSNETQWRWYTAIPPFSIVVNRDVVEGRRKLNVSEWGTRRMDSRESAEQVEKGEMPPKIYLPLHPEANLTGAARQEFIRGLNATFGGRR